MKGILADADITGQVRALVDTFYRSAEWSEVWELMGLSTPVFADFGLNRKSPDDAVWQTCQDNGLVPITGNRNRDGPTSLEETLRTRLRPDSLPVITVSQPKSLGAKASYTSEVGIRILDILLYIDDFRGTGRLFVP